MRKAFLKSKISVSTECALREGAPQILSISVMGVRSEVLLHSLEDKGIYISAGSACSSHKRKPSATLSAMGMSKDQIESTVRLSFCEENTIEEADYFLDTMKTLVPMLRQYIQENKQEENTRYDISCIFDKICRDRHQGKKQISV